MVEFPLVQEIPFCDLIALCEILPTHGVILLDCPTPTNPQSRFSFLGVDPFQTLRCEKGKVLLNNQPINANPFDILQSQLDKFSTPTVKNLPAFQGGVAGMWGYELGGYLENLPRSKRDDLHFPDMLLGFYDIVIATDHLEKKTWIFSSGFPENEPSKRLARAQKRIAWIQDEMLKISLMPIADIIIPDKTILSTFTQATYETMVQEVIEYIRAGDIFEVNVSQRFSTQLPVNYSPWMLYRKLRHMNPAPFAAFLQYGDCIIASASPERFLKLQEGNVQARPIKGTRPRHLEMHQDRMLADELLNSEKDRAENIMIVDLMRNDLSRVCLAHSIVVPQLCGLESFKTVHHLVSVVNGKMMPGKTAVDLLKATFPGGSITGAPKIRAMEIIAQLEPTVRGPYCGSIGYIGFNGDMDLSITIRTFALKGNFLTFQTGGAITIDSDPCEEYQETLTKAQALRKTLVQPL